MADDKENCPFPSCHVSGKLQRLLCHVRQTHDSDDVPAEFVSRLNLHRCQDCRQWFLKLNQHSNQCRKSARSSLTSMSSQRPSGDSNPHPRPPGAEASEGAESNSVVTPAVVNARSHCPIVSSQVPPSVHVSCTVPSQAWQFIRDLSVETILRASPPRTINTIKSGSKALFQECCLYVMRQIRDNPLDESPWKLFFLLPRMLLSPLSRGGRASSKQVKSLYHQFLNFEWGSLAKFNESQPSKTTVDNRLETRKAALRLIRCGELSRASRVFMSSGLAPPTSQTVKKLSDKHPKSKKEISQRKYTSDQISLSRSQLFKAIQSSPNGSGTGPSGWRYEHFRVLLENEELADCLYFACSCIAQGNLPDPVTSLLSSSRLIALPKPNGDVRPIAIGETLRRLTAKAMCMQKRSDFANFFHPLQHGVATDGGLEMLVHHVQLLLEEDCDRIFVKTDVKNAFNSVHRQHLLEQVSSRHPDILHHVSQMYSKPSSLLFQQGGSPVIIQSEEGIHQGDPLGPALFSTAIHPILSDLQNSNPSIRVLAYLDDVFMVGLPQDVLSALDDLRPAFEAIGLSIANHKCKIYSGLDSPCLSSNTASSIPVTSDGTVILGTPIGRDDFIFASCDDTAKSGSQLCDKLVDLGDVQSAMLLLRYCHVPRLNHLARTVSPALLLPAARIHDSLTRKTFTLLMGYENIGDKPWAQASLPIRVGGFGMTPLVSLSQCAFVSSWAHSIKELPNYFSSLNQILHNVVHGDHGDPQRGSIAQALREAVPSDKQLEDMLRNKSKLQRKLTQDLASTAITDMIMISSCDREAARLRSLQGKGAGAWINTIPTSQKLALESRDFRLAACMRLGLSMPFKGYIQRCDCGVSLDGSGYHFLTCKWGGGPVWSHESIATVWADCLRDLHIHHRREPRNRYSNSNDRPDISVFDCGSGSNVDLDISLAHPWSSEIVSSAAHTDGAAALKREEKKLTKYYKQLLPGGESFTIVPLVLEHFGRWGKESECYLQQLSLRSTDDLGRLNRAEFLLQWRQRISVQLQKCNAKVIYRKVEGVLRSGK